MMIFFHEVFVVVVVSPVSAVCVVLLIPPRDSIVIKSEGDNFTGSIVFFRSPIHALVVVDK